MGLLGDFLESFYGTRGIPKSIWAQVRRERVDTDGGEASRRQPIGRRKPRAKTSHTVVAMEFWAMLPGKVRVDSTRVHDGESESTVEVSAEGERFERLADGSIEVDGEPRRGRREGDSQPNDFRRHFDRGLIRLLFASLELEFLGECRVAGRDCVQIRAKPLPVGQIWPHWLPTEADEYQLAADLEFPSLLSIKAQLAGRTFETFEVVNVSFNGEIDPNVFDVKPLSGKQRRSATPVTQSMTLQAAIEKVSFTVLLPKLDSCAGEPDIHFQPARGRRADEQLVVSYHGTGAHNFWFDLRANLDPEMQDRLEWEEIELAGRRFQLSDPEADGGKSILLFCQAGTWVEIVSDLPRHELLRVAQTFEPVNR